MDRLKLISIRVEKDVLADIDALSAKSNGITRSAMINNILHAVLRCASPQVLWRLVSTWQPDKSGYTVDFFVSKEKLVNLPHED